MEINEGSDNLSDRVNEALCTNNPSILRDTLLAIKSANTRIESTIEEDKPLEFFEDTKILQGALGNGKLWQLQKQAKRLLPEEYATGEFELTFIRGEVFGILPAIARLIQSHIPIISEM